MIRRLTGVAALLAIAGCAGASEKPANFLYDSSHKNGTIWPKPIKDSGELKWNDHRQDLSRWVTLSYDDKRDAVRPTKANFSGPINGDAKRGEKIAKTKKKGNCEACHQLPGSDQFGDSGPPLANLSYRDRDPAWIYQQIFDARIHNPITVMPPYGANSVLTDQDIRDLTAYLRTFK